MKELKHAEEIAGKIASKLANADDAAVSQYILQQCHDLRKAGKSLDDYALIRESGNLSYDNGDTVKMGVMYKLVHKKEAIFVTYPEDGDDY